ncbi:MBL fold metallo-hydrolase [Sagittula sp. SSi028]|uniref:MBL fold metallo-hydrolase n=1 Tax=Sagittula sp. SSi028 TaxID=3400636 RepID=UPI003AF52D67
MTLTRRTFLHSVAATGAVTVIPFAARAEAHMGDTFETGMGPVSIHPVQHASIVMETPVGVIYVDPVGEAASYEDLPSPDLILITHEHGDHYNAETLSALIPTDKPVAIYTNPAVFDMLEEDAKERAEALANGDSATFGDLTIDAIPAHNTTEERMNFHPEGRDNGYVLTMGDFKIYISGDTEPTPEMEALEGIDIAFLCMNLPFTMDAEQAAEATKAFQPKVVYPYHFRGRDDGTQDPEAFAEMVGDASEVKIADWYGDHDHS